MARRTHLLTALAALSWGWCGTDLGRAQAPPSAPPQAPAGAAPVLSAPRPMPGAMPPGGATVTELPVPAPQPTDQRFPINLATALRLADGRPLIVAAAQASAWVAEARLQRAKVIGVPDLNLGFDYTRHDGLGPDTLRGVNIPFGVNALGQPTPGSFGRPLDQNVNFFYGGGALFLMKYATDIIFEPLAARQKLSAARWDIQTAKNDALLMTAKAYFNVHKYRGQYAGALDVVIKGRKLVTEVSELSKDLVPAVEIDRVRTLVADMEQQAASARQYWRRASADLTQVLRLDPRAVVEPLEKDHLQITLIDPARPLDDLMPIALTNRPELAAHQAEVQASLVRIRQEKLRPLLPVVQLQGMQTPYEQWEFGVNGLGRGGKLNNWLPRDDISPQLMWQAANLGLGNAAMVKWRRGEASKVLVELYHTQDMVAADVTQAQARVQSAAARVLQAERELIAALINYNGNVEGLKQTKRFGNVLVLVFRPQEAVFALQLLKLAYDDYFLTVADYNQAQFEMFHALGYPAKEIEYVRSAGEVLPVDTTRPPSLPPVGVGPPPATR
jgi:outer membrane protein TolC